MKKNHLYIFLFLVALLCACTKDKNDSKHIKNSKNDTIIDFPVTNIDNRDTLYQDDSLCVILHNIDYTYSLIIEKDNEIRIHDLDKLNIPVKVPMELNWHNDQFICITTWFSGAQANKIFIPKNIEKDIVSYRYHDIKSTDSINNNIIYGDTVYKDQFIIYKVENLISKKSVSFQILINSNNTIYPFYNKIEMSEKYVFVETEEEDLKIDIRGVY